MRNTSIHKTPLVSVIIPVFNREDLIDETLASVSAQTYKNWEIIIVDDHSTDNTVEKILSIAKKDNRFKFFKRTKIEQGGSVCRNIGIEKATGDFIIFLDSDDLLAPWCIEQRIEAMSQYPDINFGVFNAETFLMKPGDGKLHTVYLSSKNPLYHFIAGHNIWQTTCPIWKKKFVEKLRGFNEAYQRFQDTEFHFRALNTDNVSYKVFYQLKPDCYYRLTYPQRSIGFWDAVIDNNILYLIEVTGISKEKLNMNLYKASITILLFYAATYSLKANKVKTVNLLNAVKLLPARQYISGLNFSLLKMVLVAHKNNLLAGRLFKAGVSRILFYVVSKHIKQLT